MVGEKRKMRQSVSRILFTMAIHLRRPVARPAFAVYPDDWRRSASALCHPYLTLLSMGFTMPDPVTRTAVVSYTHRFTLTAME